MASPLQDTILWYLNHGYCKGKINKINIEYTIRLIYNKINTKSLVKNIKIPKFCLLHRIISFQTISNLKPLNATFKIKYLYKVTKEFHQREIQPNEFWQSWNLLYNIENGTNDKLFVFDKFRDVKLYI